MNATFIFHLYQPSFQADDVFKTIYKESYAPILKLIKNKRFFKVTLNTPLSLLELMDKHGYTQWLDDLKGLVDSGRVELVGSAAYHPLLTRLPQKSIEDQIILNEYGLGYYLGRRQGFEGEDAILIKDLSGFFPPELAINTSVAEVLNSLNYSWVLVEQSAIPKDVFDPAISVYKFKNLKLLVRNSTLSNQLAFKRDALLEGLAPTAPFVVALDGETFGHHNPSGIQLLSQLISSMHDAGTRFMTAGSLVLSETLVNLEEVVESCWADTWAYWDDKSNSRHALLWKALDLCSSRTKELPDTYNDDTSPNSILWGDKSVYSVSLAKCLNSDQFWLLSGAEIVPGIHLDPDSSLDMILTPYERLLATVDDKEFSSSLEHIIEGLKEQKDPEEL